MSCAGVDRTAWSDPSAHARLIHIRPLGSADVFNQLLDLVSNASGWAYLVLFLFAALDVLIPIVPSETAVITAGVVASTGGLSLPIVIVAAACGASLGDNIAYWIGRRYGARLQEGPLKGEKWQKRIAWGEQQLNERGAELIAVGRFIPGGRTAVTLSAGTLHYPWPRFFVVDAAAAVGWASFAALLGYIGGASFEDAPWKGLVLALAISFSIAGGIELVRWLQKRRKGRGGPPE
jgi:membrane-associated protein